MSNSIHELDWMDEGMNGSKKKKEKVPTAKGKGFAKFLLRSRHFSFSTFFGYNSRINTQALDNTIHSPSDIYPLTVASMLEWESPSSTKVYPSLKYRKL